MTALRILAITGLCTAGWLTVAAIITDTTANTLYHYGSDQ